MSTYRLVQNFVRRHGIEILLVITVFFLIRAFLLTRFFGEEPSPLLQTREFRDWHDYAQQKRDAQRRGDGEQGKPVNLTDPPTPEELELTQLHGFKAYVSDKISVERAVPDIRHKDCRNKLYARNLPAVSVIFIFYNEHYSVLLRSIHSVVNRTPPELLQEIILVDDGSSHEQLKAPLEHYVATHFQKGLIKFVRIPEKSGLMSARVAGARKATAPVLVFFDSHIEANYNWLPPLLNPLVIDRRTVTLPLIDFISHDNFQYSTQDEGARGVFDWKMDYKRLPIREQLRQHPTEPFDTPIMAGGLFVMARDFFWELGGYDPKLILWGAEQYELSFKIWMCGGRMIEVPCSRVGHVYRSQGFAHEEPPIKNYVYYNIKRVAEVWMDEYKEVIYKHDKKGIFYETNPGDLSARKALRESLNCKSFDWFMKQIAPDILHFYPTEWPEPYAHGIIQSMADPNLCLDSLTEETTQKVELRACSKNLDEPSDTQNFELSSFRDLRLFHTQLCVESSSLDSDSFLELVDCHQANSSIWYYDRMNFWIRMHFLGMFCVEALPKKSTVRITECDKNNRQLRWHFGNVNHSALNQFSFKENE